jgi:hypothetical protein
MGEEPGVSDEVLWLQVINGDGDAFGMLFDRHHDRVWRHALKVLGLPHVAEDVTAVVFYEAWRRRANIRMVNNPASLAQKTPSGTGPVRMLTAGPPEAARPGICSYPQSPTPRPEPARPGGSCSRQRPSPSVRWLWVSSASPRKARTRQVSCGPWRSSP